jgi:periplasmic protein TonB
MRHGIGIASTNRVLHIVDLGPPVPLLPSLRWPSFAVPIAVAASLHVAGAFVIVVLARHPAPTVGAQSVWAIVTRDEVRHFVFIASDSSPSGGGGGGGNRQARPVRHAEAVGSDTITLRVAEPMASAGRATDVTTLPQVLLEARPLASGSVELIGLPVGGVSLETSTGPGSGGGVGEGVGIGIGPGRGPGIGPGSGGGIGGGVYRLGGPVTAPRVITEIKPTYTNEALLQKIQGTVILELVVQANGRPSGIRVVRSLDPGGLDEQAIVAASQWRFEPGRLAGSPVDVLVTVMLDFWIR